MTKFNAGIVSNRANASSAKPVKSTPKEKKERKGNGRLNKPNYKKAILLSVVRKELPCGASGWNTVAYKYHDKSKEEEMRDPDAIKTYFNQTMCNNMKKPTGKSGDKPDPIYQAQEVANMIMRKASSNSVGGGGRSTHSSESSSNESASDASSIESEQSSAERDHYEDVEDYGAQDWQADHHRHEEEEWDNGSEKENAEVIAVDESVPPTTSTPARVTVPPYPAQSTPSTQKSSQDADNRKSKHHYHHHSRSPVGKTKNARVANPRSSAAGVLSGMVDAIKENKAESSIASTMRTMMAAQQQQSQQFMTMMMQQQQQQMQMQMQAQQQQMQLFAMLAGRPLGLPSIPVLPQAAEPCTPATMVSPATEVPK